MDSTFIFFAVFMLKNNVLSNKRFGSFISILPLYASLFFRSKTIDFEWIPSDLFVKSIAVFAINLFDLGGSDNLSKKGYKIESLMDFPGH